MAYSKRMVFCFSVTCPSLGICNRTHPWAATVKNTPLRQNMYRIRTSMAYTKRAVLCISLTRPSAVKMGIRNRTHSWINFSDSPRPGS
ncbi:hypothetical protein C8J57DRAFT_1373414, partial [Mycena rebaudengoi]